MGENEKSLDADEAASARPAKKPWHAPALRKIDPATALAKALDAAQGGPREEQRRRA